MRMEPLLLFSSCLSLFMCVLKRQCMQFHVPLLTMLFNLSLYRYVLKKIRLARQTERTRRSAHLEVGASNSVSTSGLIDYLVSFFVFQNIILCVLHDSWRICVLVLKEFHLLINA